ncbi:hypothetical protein Calag_0422 [Caldisphaera lagunensis DSM 15908]|uniref:Uncharacterized protein n=1 Tax=Caldisphaera lagunensis (strain DSM 15908 / JCM 11604 / ANMR 0165 / IC-154) TaxID=1056495 RepID=L0A8N0_CALLD|nr:hypothetical protein [Caldisphaera lagunensis]AFZ70191.1 hypothetical protein Calag_0422 [Caldisphaera lagunensis DSM 15908]
MSSENIIKVGGKQIEINDEVLLKVRKYVNTEMNLDELSKELGLDGWEEAYEFIKKIPAWMLRKYSKSLNKK